MAQDQLSTIFNALSQTFDPILHRQWNNTTVFLGALAARATVSADAQGKNVAFTVEFTGATAGTVAEGSDVATSEYAQDIDVPAILPWATYRSSFWVTEQEVDAAARSVGSADDLMDVFGARILSAGNRIANSIETDSLSGTGVDASGNPSIIGIYGGALAASGAYAGQNTALYSEWASNNYGNGGTTRALSLDLVEQADAGIFTASSMPWDLAMGSVGIARKYADIFTQGTNPLVRMNDGASAPAYGLGSAQGVGGIEAGQMQNLFLKGVRFYRNRSNPVNKMSLLNTKVIEMKYLPRRLTPADMEFMQLMGIEGSSGAHAPGAVVQATGMPMRITSLAKTGDSTKVTCRITCQMVARRRNACALITDIAET